MSSLIAMHCFENSTTRGGRRDVHALENANGREPLHSELAGKRMIFGVVHADFGEQDACVMKIYQTRIKGKNEIMRRYNSFRNTFN